MSWFNQYIETPLKEALAKAEAVSPASAASLQSSVSTASGLVDNVVTSLANLAVNYGLSLIPAGSTVAPLADEFLDALIAAATAKKSS